MDNQKIAVKNDTTITKTEDHVPAQMPVIDEDQSMSSVDKALNKRKVLATDVCIGLGAVGGTLGLIWLGKKVFTA